MKRTSPTQKRLLIILETQWKIVSKSTLRKNVCKWYSTTIIFGVNNQLGKIGFIKVINTYCTESYVLKTRVLHLWLHFLQIIFVIFQNFCWSITWTWIWSTPLFQTIFFGCPWATLIFIITEIIADFIYHYFRIHLFDGLDFLVLQGELFLCRLGKINIQIVAAWYLQLALLWVFALIEWMLWKF